MLRFDRNGGIGCDRDVVIVVVVVDVVVMVGGGGGGLYR